MKATLNDLLNAKGVSEPLREAVKVLTDRLEAWENVFSHLGTPDEVGNEWHALSDRHEAAEKERDALRAENEALAANLRGKHSTAGATYAHLIAERDALRTDKATLQQMTYSLKDRLEAAEKERNELSALVVMRFDLDYPPQFTQVHDSH